jgi:Trypsin-co-occurring domain 2
MAVHDRRKRCIREAVMSEPEEFDGPLGLADFLSDLRAELAEASKRAEHESLKLGVEEVTVSLDVTVTLAKKGEASAGAKAQFWVFASVEGGVKGELSSQRAATQHLTLTLKPRTEEVIIDEDGKARVIHRGVDVTGAIAAHEERPDLPAPKLDDQ